MHALRLILIGISIAMFTALGWRAAYQPAPLPPVAEIVPPAPAPAPPADPFASEESVRAELEQKLIEDSDYEPFFASFKDSFPTDYLETLEGFARTAHAARAFASLDLYMSETLRSLRRIRGLVAAQAESGLLDRLFVMQTAVMEALAAKDARLCADYVYGAASDRYYAFAAQNRTLIAEMGLANLAAIVDGQTSKIARSTPNEEDFRALEEGLIQRGLSREQIEALVDGKAPDPPLTDERMCAAGRAYMATLTALEPDIRLRIEALAAQLMART